MYMDMKMKHCIAVVKIALTHAHFAGKAYRLLPLSASLVGRTERRGTDMRGRARTRARIRATDRYSSRLSDLPRRHTDLAFNAALQQIPE